MKNKSKILAYIVTILIVAVLSLAGYNISTEQANKIQNSIENVVTEEVKEVDNQSTTEIPALTEEDEQTVEVQETEAEAFEEQGEVAYNGANGTPDVQVGNYAGLTYYSQIDSRWKDKMYSSVGDTTQTMGTSACGPTSSAMVVSSIKGTITPPEMADLYMQYGYRSANAGTYWSAFKWTADVFNIEYSEAYKLDDAVNMLQNGYYIIASCNQGLFTYGGHFIVLTGVENGNIKVYDPYLYNGKFDVSSRRGLATVSGNTVYVSIDNFRNYANYQKFFCFKNDRTDVKENTTNTIITNTTSNVTNTNYQVKITANSGLNIRSGASANYSRVGGYTKNSVVTILTESNGWGKTNLGWISLAYTSRYSSAGNYQTVGNYRTGTYKVNCSKLNVRTGPGTNYRIKSLSQLTYSARKQGGYVRGVRCTVSKVSGNWGLTPSGWICLDYCTRI